MPRRVHRAGAVQRGEHHVPAAPLRRCILRAALDQRAPIHRLQINIQPGLGQHIGTHQRQRVHVREIAGIEHDNLFAVVASRLDRCLGCGEIALAGQHRHARLAGHRAARGEHADVVAPQALIVAGHRRHEIRLAHHLQHRPANGRVVERRIQLVEPHNRNHAGGIVLLHPQPRRFAQHRQQIGRWHPPIDLAGHHRRGRRAGIRDHRPLDPIDMHDLRPSGVAGPIAGARHVAVELRVGHVRARHPFIGEKTKRPAADHLADLLGRIGQSQPLRHDQHRIGKRARHRKPLLQPEPHDAIIRRRQLLGRRHQRLAEAVTHRPAANARDHIARQHGIAVMKQQPRPKGDRPDRIALDAMAIDHLRLNVEAFVHAVERVEHHIGMVSRDVRGGPDGIEHRQISLGNEPQCAACFRANQRRRH